MQKFDREFLKDFIRYPLVPVADNFTPRERTPWGGYKIARQYKNWLNLPPNLMVGESWEISGHRSFPNKFVLNSDSPQKLISLPELLQQFPEEILGSKVAAKFKGQIPILVKLLDTTENLSVQVHPNDAYRNLKPGEMGKTEAWYILDAEPGCGLYLGLKEGVTREKLQSALQVNDDVSQLMNFVDVKPGENYFIPAGTVHAIGKGMTLIEPQQTSETTYRLWDWNRRYDAAGKQSPDGKPRELHITDSLAVTNFSGTQGKAFVAQIKSKPQVIFEDEGNENILLLRTQHFIVEKVVLRAARPMHIRKEDFFESFTVVAGKVELTCGSRTISLPAGQSVLIPATVSGFQLKSEGSAELIKVYYPVN